MSNSMWSEVEELRLAQIEKRLAEIGASSKGQREFHAERLSDVMDQVSKLCDRIAGLEETAKTAEAWRTKAGAFLNELRAERKKT